MMKFHDWQKMALLAAFRFDARGKPIHIYEDEIYREIYFWQLESTVTETTKEKLYKLRDSKKGFSETKDKDFEKLALIDKRLLKLRGGKVRFPGKKYYAQVKSGSARRFVDFLAGKGKNSTGRGALEVVEGKGSRKKMFITNFDFAFKPLETEKDWKSLSGEARLFYNAVYLIESEIAKQNSGSGGYLQDCLFNSSIELGVKSTFKEIARELWFCGRDNHNFVRQLKTATSMDPSKNGGSKINENTMKKLIDKTNLKAESWKKSHRGHKTSVMNATQALGVLAKHCVGFCLSERSSFGNLIRLAFGSEFGGIEPSFMADDLFL